jgi:DNA-binding IclR family transcriptional regulator
MSTAAARVVCVLEVLTQAGRPLSVTETGQSFGADKSTVSRLRRDLACHALLEREDGRSRSRLGVQLAQFARAALEGTDLPVVSAPHLRNLCSQTNESVHLSSFRAEQVTPNDKAGASTFVWTCTEVGDVASPHCTASGKAILAWFPEAVLACWLEGRRITATPKGQ